MQSNYHDLPRSEAEWSHRFGRDNRSAVDRETLWVILNKGVPLSEADKTLTYPYSETAKLVARRTKLSRPTVYRYLEEACVEDESAWFVTIDNPGGPGLLILLKPDHPTYFPDGTPRTSARRDDGRGAANV